MTELQALQALSKAAGGTGSNLAIIAAAFTLACVVIALTLPKILNSIKSDRLDGNVLARLQALETKAIAQDAKIHRYAVRTTKLSVLVLKMHGLLMENKVDLSQDIVDDIVELTKEMKEDEE